HFETTRASAETMRPRGPLSGSRAGRFELTAKVREQRQPGQRVEQGEPFRRNARGHGGFLPKRRGRARRRMAGGPSCAPRESESLPSAVRGVGLQRHEPRRRAVVGRGRPAAHAPHRDRRCRPRVRERPRRARTVRHSGARSGGRPMSAPLASAHPDPTTGRNPSGGGSAGRRRSAMSAYLRAHAARLVAVGALAGVVSGLALWALGDGVAADSLWAAATALLLGPLTLSVARSLLRRDVGVDAIALVSMAGSLALGEYLAGAVVALMLAGGNA